jgi:hypothetical protein
LLRAGLARARLRVAPTDDPLERDADRAADGVLRALRDEGSTAAPCSCGGTCDRCRRKAASPLGPAPVEVGDRVADLGPGRPLGTPLREAMEPQFGVDLASVRIHDGPEADAAARSIDALAFTLGPNIAFAAGRFAPDTDAGLHLLGHELAHVAQQGGAAPGMAYRQAAAGGPSGDCESLFEQIKELVRSLKNRHQEALIDRYNLFKEHRWIKDAGPDGSWEGHQQFFEKEQKQLQTKRTNWLLDDCDDDDFEGGPELLRDSEEFAYNRKYPSRPDPSAHKVTTPEETGVPTWVWELLGATAAAALIACFATGVCEVGAVLTGLGVAARAAILFALEAAGVTLVGAEAFAAETPGQPAVDQAQPEPDDEESSPV